MATEFRKIHLLRVSFQATGASVEEVNFAISLATKLFDPVKFKTWNSVLDEKTVQVLGFMLTEKGKPVADAYREKFFSDMIRHHGITAEELKKFVDGIARN